MFVQTGGQGETTGTNRQEAPPVFPEGIHFKIRVQPEVKIIKDVLKEINKCAESLPVDFYSSIFTLVDWFIVEIYYIIEELRA